MIPFFALLLAATPVWIDTDPSMQPGGHEVDDGFAMLQAFHSPELAVRGISVCFGNAPLETAYPIGRDFVAKFGPKGMKVYRGASGSSDLGKETDASRALAAALRKEPLTVLILGPATNIATVLVNHPELRSQVKEIIAVAGRRVGQHFTTGTKDFPPFRDFNFEMDSQAFQVLLNSKIPIVLAPWEISSKVWLKADDLDALRKSSPAGEYLYQPARDWLSMWEKAFGTDGFNPFDTLAVAWVTTPDLLKCEDLPVQIQVLPDDTGPGKKDKPYLLLDAEIHSARKVHYCYEASSAFKPELLKRLMH